MDKNFKVYLASKDSTNVYAADLSDMVTKYVNTLTDVRKKRGEIYKKVLHLRSVGDFEKADRIEENCLGMTKYNNMNHRYRNRIKAYVNTEIRRYFKNEAPVDGFSDLFLVCDSEDKKNRVFNEVYSWLDSYVSFRLRKICKNKFVSNIRDANTSISLGLLS